MKIIVASTTPAKWVQPLTAALPEATVVPWQDDGVPVAADVAVVWRPPPALFTRERKLQAIFNLGAGVDGLLTLPTLPADVPVVRLEDAGMAVQMAEYAVYALVRASRQFGDYARQQRDGLWQDLPEIRRAEWPVGVLGMGVIGARVASTLAALEYPVAGWSRSGRGPDGIQTYAGAAGLADFLARTRVLVNLLPLTTETRDILCRDTLQQLLPGAYLINMGRGEHLVEEDLLALLDAGHMAGATLDVFRTEPLPPEHRFWHDPRVTVTPHIAAISLRQNTVDQIAAKIRGLMRGEPLTGVVARDRGY